MTNPNPPKPLTLERLLSDCTRVGDCLIWNKGKDWDGYGLVKSMRKTYRVSRLVLALTLKRELAAGEMALHSCDRPSCCEPSHIHVGSASDNMKEKAQRNRAPRGTKHGNAKLDYEAVNEIRVAHLFGVDQRTLSRTFGVSDSLIGNIVTCKGWVSRSV